MKIDSLIETKLLNTDNSFNGVILITQNGKTKYLKSKGFSDIENKRKFKLNDQFAIMSISKQITAVLILKEVEKGKVNLRSPIKNYLPYLKQSWADSVTVYQLLNHTSGIVDIDKPLVSKPGKTFNYSDLSFILLGKIIEFTSQKPYFEMANNLFKTIKMKNTKCYINEMIGLSKSYEFKNNQWSVEKLKITNDDLSAFGIVSTVKDLSIWNNNLHQGKVLKPESYNLMISYSVKAKHVVFGEKEVGYGCGIRISDVEKINYIGHTGSGYGFASTNLYFPKKKISIVILENKRYQDMISTYFFHLEIKKIVMQSKLLNN